ncbi:MAG: hypothetical protein ACFFDT_02435 [Candidatus Hodarchaeota archaeon]
MRQWKSLLLGTVAIQTILFPGVTSWGLRGEIQINRGSQFSRIIQTSSLGSIQYEDHSPILIDGNANFTALVDAENWPGEGTPITPYIIDRLNITGSVDNTLIDIRNTQVYFRISNCLLSQGSLGIYLNNVTNGQLF